MAVGCSSKGNSIAKSQVEGELAAETGLKQLLAFFCGDVLKALHSASQDLRYALGGQVEAAAESTSAPEANCQQAHREQEVGYVV